MSGWWRASRQQDHWEISKMVGSHQNQLQNGFKRGHSSRYEASACAELPCYRLIHLICNGPSLQRTATVMSSETLVLRMSSSSSSSLVGEGPSAPFLDEEAYRLILRALVETGLGEEIWLSEDNIGVVARAASRALFGQNGVFSQFLVVPRVECAISVLLWRVRVNATCEGVPRVPIHVLASSLAGLLDNTKLYASKQGAMLFIWVDFANRFAALHSPMTKRVKFDPPPIITRTTPTSVR